MKNHCYIFFLLLFFSGFGFAQQNKIKINATLNTQKDQLLIQQEIVYYNKTESTLNKIYLHNWANSFKGRKTPLSKRFIENFKKDLYFAKPKDLGFTIIKNISSNYASLNYKELENQPDIIELELKKPLQNQEKTTINITYIVKLPHAKFTGYGKTQNGYNLRYWYITPALYNDGNWQLMSNLNLNDLYEDSTTFNIYITIPNHLSLESSIQQKKETNNTKTTYLLNAKNERDVIISIEQFSNFKTFKTGTSKIITNILKKEINLDLTKDLLNREVQFLKDYLGELPIDKIYLDKVTQAKNPVYGLSQLPDFLNLFSDVFKHDITLFKALSNRYLKQTLLLNERKEYWLLDGLQNYLMMEYVHEFYPEVKILGKISDYWFLKNYNIAKLDFNKKYPFVYQFSARKFLDQSLTTPLDSLSNFNRKIVSKYKAGLGFKYLEGYLGKEVLDKTIKEFYKKNNTTTLSSCSFKNILTNNTSKDISWFFNDYLQTNKKIDYTIKKVTEHKDSLQITIKNKRNITTPIAFYGIKNDSIKLKKWISNIKTSKTISVPKGEFDQLVLNYENIYPEYNTLDNYYNTKKTFFKKPLKFTLIKDIEAPNYNQLFYEPKVSYNFYDGIILGLKLDNKPFIKRNLEFKIEPAYAFKSKTINGSFSIMYNHFFEKTNIYNIRYGIAGTTLQYKPELSYKALSPFINLTFKRKSLRDASNENITAKLVHINKEISPLEVQTEQDKYSIFSLKYNYTFPNIISEKRYSFSTEYAKNFSKVAAEFWVRKLTSSNTQLDFRVFAGAFLHNNSQKDYFSFGLDRAKDYLFELNYFGRSEESGIFSQQYIITEGGFKSVLPTRFANQYMLSLNSSVGIWRWVELYNDVAFLKNKNKKLFFGYENGIRFNFVHNIFEIYFPLYSNNGWEVSQQAYPQKIRFIFTGNLNRVYNFFRRGFL